MLHDLSGVERTLNALENLSFPQTIVNVLRITNDKE